ncbi:MAG TPA: signal peptidase II [Actinomycetota bacterium]|nr:signal peptidase II [Actinomycetota bacterium]
MRSSASTASAAKNAAASSSLRGYRLLGVVAALVVAADQVTKTVALETLSDGPVDVLWGAVTLRITINSGGAFGVFQGVPGFFLVATVGIIAGILLWARHVDHRGWLLALGLVLGGGVGNVVDRVLRDHGGVVDFVDLHWWPVFNVADSCIVTGVGLLLLLGARDDKGG